MNQRSSLDELLTMDAMLDSLKVICSRLLKKEEDSLKPLSTKKLLEQRTKAKNIIRLRKNINNKLSDKIAA